MDLLQSLTRGGLFIFLGRYDGGGVNMFGLNDPWIALAYLLCLAATGLCVGYAFWAWRLPETDKFDGGE